MNKLSGQNTGTYFTRLVNKKGQRISFVNEDLEYEDSKMLQSDNREDAIQEAKSIADKEIKEECYVHVYKVNADGSSKKVHPKGAG